MKSYFSDIVTIIKNSLEQGEIFTAWFSGEIMDYARFNHGSIRQAGTVTQQFISINLIKDRKQVTTALGLSHHLVSDTETIKEAVKRLRNQLAESADDPYIMINEGNDSSSTSAPDHLQDKDFIVEEVLREAQGLDLVGCYIGGPIFRGFANSFGQENWFSKKSFVLDTSVYHSGDKAIKQSYSDTVFNSEILHNKMLEARDGLKLFDKGQKTLKPGSYRAYFAPSAVHEILSMLNWGGFSHKSLAVKNSPLLPLFNEQKQLSSQFSLSENSKDGVGPNFQPQGFLKPERLSLIEQGKLCNTLIAPKTAKEYELLHNGADDDEAMASMDMAGGSLEDKDILKTLKDGLYINNLWYLNFSDRQSGRLTGMTRFFCYTVKDGQREAPFSVLRFDESIYRIFGESLQHLTKNRELIIDNNTYDERSTSCAILPGIIAENVRFTL